MACNHFVDCYKSGTKNGTENCSKCLVLDSCNLICTCQENRQKYILHNLSDHPIRIREYKTDEGDVCQGITGERCDYLFVLSKHEKNIMSYRFVYIELKSGSTGDFDKGLRQLKNTSEFMFPVIQSKGSARIISSKIPAACNTSTYREVSKYFGANNLICKSRQFEENASGFFQ